MRNIFVVAVFAVLMVGIANASDEFVGTWSASSKEVLTITRAGDSFSAEFIRKNVKAEYEKITFPAEFINGVLVISGSVGTLSATYDSAKNVLVLGGVKEFKQLSAEQAKAQLTALEQKLGAQ